MKFLNIIITVITAVAALFIGFFAVSKETMGDLYIKWIFYVLSANVLLAIFALIRTENKSIEWVKCYFKRHLAAVLVAAALMSAGAVVSKPDFKILADETNLLAMSESLYEERECKNYTSLLYYYFGFKDVISYVNDKRPALFPLTVSYFHSFLGYRPENVFIVNLLAGFISLLLLYHLINRKFGRFWGICGMLLLAAHPLFIIYTTSGGFETFNLMFSLIIFWYLIKFIDSPNAVSAEALLLLLPLIGQTRYESVVAVFTVVPIIFICLPKPEYFKFGYKLPLVPLFFIPVAWLRIISDDAHAWQVNSMNDSFSFNWFLTNTKRAFIFFFSENKNYGIIPIVSCLAIFGFVFLIFDIYGKSNKNKASKLFWSSILLFYLLHAVIRFSYSMCDLASVSATRLAMIFLPIIAYLALSFLVRCHGWLNFRKSYTVIVLMALFALYWPACGLTAGVRSLTLYREFRAAREFLEANFPRKDDYIIVADRSNMYVPLKYSAISFKYMQDNPDKVISNFKCKTYSYLIVIQMFDRKSDKPTKDCIVPEQFKLETLYEYQISIAQYLRISRWKL